MRDSRLIRTDGGVTPGRDETPSDEGFDEFLPDDSEYELPYTRSGRVPSLGAAGTIAWAARVLGRTPALLALYFVAGVGLTASYPLASASSYGGLALGLVVGFGLAIVLPILAARYAAVEALGGRRDFGVHLGAAVVTVPYVLAVSILLGLAIGLLVGILSYGLGLLGVVLGGLIALYVLFHTFLAVTGAAIEGIGPRTAIARSWSVTSRAPRTVLVVLVVTNVVVSAVLLVVEPTAVWPIHQLVAEYVGVRYPFRPILRTVPWWILGGVAGLVYGWVHLSYARLYLQGRA